MVVPKSLIWREGSYVAVLQWHVTTIGISLLFLPVCLRKNFHNRKNIFPTLKVMNEIVLARIFHLNLGYGIEMRYYLAYGKDLTDFCHKWENLMNEGCKAILRLILNHRLKLEFHESKVVRHARYVTFQKAEVLVSRSLFYEILKRIGRLKPVRFSTSYKISENDASIDQIFCFAI